MQQQEFEIQPSLLMGLFMGGTHLVGVVIILCVSLPSVIKLMLGVMILYHFFRLNQQHRFWGGPLNSSLFRLKRGRDYWQIDEDGTFFDATLLGDSTVTPFVSVLLFKKTEDSAQKSYVIFCDALPKDQYRQLRVALKCA